MCAGLVSIELEDANADPDHSGFCGARALRLQRQSGDQSPRTGEPLRERSQLQSVQSLELRAEQRRDRPLRAGNATKAEGAIYHAYSCFARGLDLLNSAYNYLDLTPLGRQEEGLSLPMSRKLRDEYGA